MLVLAIDTSTSAISVALHDGTAVVATESHLDARAHTEWVSPLIARCFDAAGAAPSDLTDVVVGTGPGPFTGLRVGVVSGMTMAYAVGVPAHGVCSLDVLAEQGAAVMSGELLVASDARRKEVYWARYAAADGVARPLTEAAVGLPGDLPASVRALPTVGRGPVLYPDLFPAPLPLLDVDAGVLAGIAVRRLAAGAELPVAPEYLRRPDALTSAERAAQ